MCSFASLSQVSVYPSYLPFVMQPYSGRYEHFFYDNLTNLSPSSVCCTFLLFNSFVGSGFVCFGSLLLEFIFYMMYTAKLCFHLLSRRLRDAAISKVGCAVPHYIRLTAIKMSNIKIKLFLLL